MKTVIKNFQKLHKTLLITSLITFLSLYNFNDLSTPSLLLFNGADKLVHFIMYFTLSLVFMLECYYNALVKPTKKRLMLINLIPLLMSVSLEFVQEFLTSSRTGSFYDEIFNLLGIAAAFIVFQLVKKWKFVHTIIIFPFKAE